jgi:FlaA1/EpsC-like NDP-sugar epimerase
MTIPEAARLVLQAAAIGDTGQVMVLDMGKPIRIVDLARQLIRLSGHTIDEIPIQFTGLRPGEKLFEELMASADATLPTANPRILLARISDTGQSLPTLLSEIAALGSADGDAAVRALLLAQVPEYHDADNTRPAGA